MKRFSDRFELHSEHPEITIRHEAPTELRGVFLDLILELGLDAYDVRRICCRVLQKRANKDNFSESNVHEEAQQLLDSCEWYEFYDLVEAVYDELPFRAARGTESSPKDSLETELNSYFMKHGIGWQLISGQVEIRGPEAFAEVVARAQAALEKSSFVTASCEIHEALRDLSRRPEPDITGAIQHALVAVECAIREICDDPQLTLGKLLSKYPGLVPPPLNIALEKLWGFASEHGRHLREGRHPSLAEAELTVSIAAAIAIYLTAQLDRS